MTLAAKGAVAGVSPSPAASAAPSSRSGPALGKATAGTAGVGRRDGVLLGRPSQIPGPRPGGRAAGGGSGKCNGPPVPSPPRCGAIPPAPPPGWADGDDGDDGACAAAHGNAGNGNPLGNDDAAAVAVACEADNAGQEKDDHGGNNGDDNEDNDKWGRRA